MQPTYSLRGRCIHRNSATALVIYPENRPNTLLVQLPHSRKLVMTCKAPNECIS